MERRFLFLYIAKHQRIAAESEHEVEDRCGDFYGDLSVLSVGNWERWHLHKCEWDQLLNKDDYIYVHTERRYHHDGMIWTQSAILRLAYSTVFSRVNAPQRFLNDSPIRR